jgi:hypothetical protein
MAQDYRFQLLAPLEASAKGAFDRSQIDEQLYRHYLTSMQRLRGRAYLDDHAIQPWELDEDGRFRMRGDERSWHFLLVDGSEEVIGCARYLVHPSTVSFHELRVRHSPVAKDPAWSHKVRSAVEDDLRLIRKEGFSFVEAGGWALKEEWRGTRAALEILVASFALGHLWGGCLGYCMATVRHESSSILRRIGGSSFMIDGEAVPPYHDPQYGCQMELLRFDSRAAVERFVPLISQLKAKLAGAVAIRDSTNRHWSAVPDEAGWIGGALPSMA